MRLFFMNKSFDQTSSIDPLEQAGAVAKKGLILLSSKWGGISPYVSLWVPLGVQKQLLVPCKLDIYMQWIYYLSKYIWLFSPVAHEETQCFWYMIPLVITKFHERTIKYVVATITNNVNISCMTGFVHYNQSLKLCQTFQQQRFYLAVQFPF